jgi:hypothetical protein
VDFMHGGTPFPKLDLDRLVRIPIRTEAKLLLWTDCQSLLDHLLSRKSLPLQEQRLLGYVGILQEALDKEDFEKIFHCSGLINIVDCLTKLRNSPELERWYREQVIHFEPGFYGARAENRKLAAAELRSELSRRERLGVEVPKGAQQLRGLHKPKQSIQTIKLVLDALWEIDDLGFE